MLLSEYFKTKPHTRKEIKQNILRGTLLHPVNLIGSEILFLFSKFSASPKTTFRKNRDMHFQELGIVPRRGVTVVTSDCPAGGSHA